jgi:predicted DsbA family dithiol-disulfide isomerase
VSATRLGEFRLSDGREARDDNETSARAAPLPLGAEAAHWAREQGCFDDYHAAVFRAFFEKGEDIGRIEVLTSLAAELRLNSESLRDALESRQLEKSVLDDEREAEALAVRGVPAFFADQKAALSRRTICRQFKEVN